MPYELSCSYTHIVHVTLLIMCEIWTNNLTICIITNILYHVNYVGSYGDEICEQVDKQIATWTQDCDLTKNIHFTQFV